MGFLQGLVLRRAFGRVGENADRALAVKPGHGKQRRLGDVADDVCQSNDFAVVVAYPDVV